MSKIVQTAGRNALGKLSPEFAHYNDDVLFGENWNNQDIDVKTRSIITVVALISSGITDSSLKFHLENAKAHGVTQKEIAAIITHVAFYAGWPKGWAAFNLAKEVWNDGEGDLPYEDPAMRAHAKEMVFPIGEPNDGFAKYFVGKSYLAPVSTSQVGVYNVTFEPGLPQQLAHPSRKKRRRSNHYLRCRSRLLSRRRQACDRNETGRLHQYSGRSQALARCSFGQLVQPFGNRSSGRADFKRVVRTGNGRTV